MNLSKRIDKLETAFIQHLTESGEIRTDLKWLKRAFWSMVGGLAAIVSIMLTAKFAH